MDVFDIAWLTIKIIFGVALGVGALFVAFFLISAPFAMLRARRERKERARIEAMIPKRKEHNNE